MTIIRVLYLQAFFIILMTAFSLLAAPFLDNRIERDAYETNQCAGVKSSLQWQCNNYEWILVGDQIVFLPGFISVLMLPLTLIMAYVSYSHKKHVKDQDGKGSE